MWRIVLYLISINRCGQWGVSPVSVNSRWVELSWLQCMRHKFSVLQICSTKQQQTVLCCINHFDIKNWLIYVLKQDKNAQTALWSLCHSCPTRWFIVIRTSFIRQLGSMTDKRHGMVNYVAKCYCNDRLTAVKSSIVVNWI